MQGSGFGTIAEKFPRSRQVYLWRGEKRKAQRAFQFSSVQLHSRYALPALAYSGVLYFRWEKEEPVGTPARTEHRDTVDVHFAIDCQKYGMVPLMYRN
jgi:hypothetical protein